MQDELISIIIPVLNEEAALPKCLEACRRQEGPYEVIVVDGGSSDRTADIAISFGARVVRAPKGRASQMNAGARSSAGAILLFLHADCGLSPRSLLEIRKAVRRGAETGAFRLRYDRAGMLFRLAAGVSDLYCRITGDLFGDRAIFATRGTFKDLHGFREIALMEDLDFAVRVRRAGLRTVLLSSSVVTSARRFEGVGIVKGGWWAWRLCRAFHRSQSYDARATKFYAVPRR